KKRRCGGRRRSRRDGAWQAGGIRGSIPPSPPLPAQRTPTDAGRSRAMSTASASAEARPIVGLGLTEGVAALLARNFTVLRPPATFDPAAPVIVVQNARVDLPEMARQPGLKFIAVFGAGYDRV